ncbi:MAG TPA: class I SAM-dependent methyltransferase, partial [Anaerolineae bacterium]|nr:class I SAM-dependent methyltransferase [Anaerolineae bacterium]
MTDLRDIYNRHADRYQVLVSREDHQHNILPALNRITPLAGLDVIELGAGTGRLTTMLVPVVGTIQAFDASQPMLDVAIARLEQSPLHNWSVDVADHRSLPVEDGVADLVISGWSIVYMVVWNEKSWRVELGKALAEMRRVLRTGGTIVVLETMGTGYETPHPP